MLRRTLTVALLLAALTSCKEEIQIPVDPPEARADYRRTAVDTPISFDLRDNDYDPTAEALTVTAVGTPSHGTVLLSGGGSVTYTPDLGYEGGDSFGYTLVDASGYASQGKASISVGTSSTRVVYLSNQDDYYTQQLYLADTALPDESFVLNHRLQLTSGQTTSTQRVFFYDLSADGLTAAYTIDDDTGGVDIYVLALSDPGTVTNLTQYPPQKTVSANAPIKFSPDGQRILYLGNEATGEFELFMVALASPGVTTRIGPAFDSTQSLSLYEWSADGTKVLFQRNDTDGGSGGLSQNEVYVVDVANPSVETKLSGTATTSNGVGVLRFTRASTGTLLAYLAVDDTTDVADVYLVDYAAPATPVKMNGPVVGTGDGVFDIRFSADASRLYYVSQEHDQDQSELYTVAVAAPGVTTRLTPPRVTASPIVEWDVGTDGTFVTFTREDLVDGQADLYRVDLANPGVAVHLNPALPTNADVVITRLDAIEPRQAIFMANLESTTLGLYGLYVMDVDVPEVATELGPKLSISVGLDAVRSLDGNKVLRIADPGNRGARSLSWVDLSSPADLHRLTPERLGGHQVQFGYTQVP